MLVSYDDFSLYFVYETISLDQMNRRQVHLNYAVARNSLLLGFKANS